MKRACSTETQNPRVTDAAVQLLEHEPRPRVAAGVKARQLVPVVAPTAPPRDRPEVHRVLHAEVLERREEPLLERVPQAHLVRRPAVEPAAHVAAVVALGCGGEAEEHSRAHVREEPVVGGRLRVVELVHDDDVEVVGREVAREVHPRERLDGREDVLAARRLRVAGEELAESRVAQHGRERAAARERIRSRCATKRRRARGRVVRSPA
jgi:hypothetical protein